ncbi:MAG: NAD(+) diphosphatase [Rubellimicrobium sp.]|nr:NAD(+) diphosphatase [Rubellimicrobium sp.]
MSAAQVHGMAFAGSGLDRAQDLRRRATEFGQLRGRADTEWLVFWRGKPLVCGPADAPRLARLAPDHPALSAQTGPEILLVRGDGGQVICAEDISTWAPDAADLAATGGFFDPSEQHHPALPSDHRFVELRAMMTQLSPRDQELAATARALFGWHETHGFCARCGTRSDMREGGWRRDCPACGAQHFPRTDPVVIMLVTHGNDVLLGRSAGWPPGMMSLLAGFIEPGETVEAAVRREVREETGVRIGEVGFVRSQPWPFPASLMLGCTGRAVSRDIAVDPVELEAAAWVSRERMLRVIGGADPDITAPRPGSIARHLVEMWLAGRLDPEA